MTKPIRYYWEDFRVGEVHPIGSCTVDRDEVIAFASRYDPQPFHLDEAAGRASHFGGLVASGWHTVAMVMRLMVDSYLGESSSMGSPGVDNLRWLRPVRPGDRLRGQRITLEARASASRPGMGLVRSRWEIFNQDDELVMTMEGMGMFGRRPGDGAQ